MKIVIDVSPLSDARTLSHKVRGTGFYIENLKNSLTKYFPKNLYYFLSKLTELSEEYDVIHIPYFEPFFLTLPANNLKKTVVTVHDLTPLIFSSHFPSGIKGKLRWLIQKKRLQAVAHIITDSEASKKDIMRICKVPEKKIQVIYLAAGEMYKKISLSARERSKLLETYALPQEFALYVGDATWNKNLPRLVCSCKKAGIPLVLVGKTISEENFDHTNPWNKDLITVQQLAKENKNIVRLGFVPTEDLVRIYNIATVFVMPSLYEGFGLPILEAMKSGCPVVTTKEGSIP